MTLATYYPFTQTTLFQDALSGLPWTQILVFLPIVLGLAMVSNIQYARLPRIGISTGRGLIGLAVNTTILAFGIFSRDVFFFPLGIAYVSYGIARAAVVGFLDRGDGSDDVAGGEGEVEVRAFPGPHRRRRGISGVED
jgi:CDP-diacylglycerol--serine O-phosphatidyltransferase